MWQVEIICVATTVTCLTGLVNGFVSLDVCFRPASGLDPHESLFRDFVPVLAHVFGSLSSQLKTNFLF